MLYWQMAYPELSPCGLHRAWGWEPVARCGVALPRRGILVRLVYLGLAYALGVALGHGLWQAGLLGCGPPAASWLLPLVGILPLLFWQGRGPSRSVPPLRWPRAAGFEPPTPGPGWGVVLACGLALLAGVLRYGTRPLFPCRLPGDLAAYNAVGQESTRVPPVRLQGYVDRYPLHREGRWELVLQVERLAWGEGERAVAGRVRLLTRSPGPFEYGQPVQATGILVEPPRFPDFDYRSYLAQRGIHSLLQRARVVPLAGPPRGSGWLRGLYAARRRGEAVLQGLLPEPHAALANGMLLGVEAGIPAGLYEQFNRTGASHVIVISGSNVAVVAGVLMALAARILGRGRALLPTLAGIGIYALAVGGDAAVVRAGLMGGLFVLATGLGRRSTALVSLVVACGTMLLLDPRTLWDVGFQLSAAATGGLILFGPRLDRAVGLLGHRLGGLWRARGRGSEPDPTAGMGVAFPSLFGVLREGVLLTLAANLTTLPLILHHFGRLSLVSPLTNLLIAPVQPLIMLWGGGGILLGLLGLEPLAQVLLWVPYLCLAWTVFWVQWTAALPAAALDVPRLGWPGLLLAYGGIGMLLWRPRGWRGRPRLPGRWLQGAGLAVGGAAAALLWMAVAQGPDGRLHVIFLDVGQGDGILIVTPSGRQVLVDGGSDLDRLSRELGAVMPFWDRSLDLVIATHPDQDHTAAQEGLPARYRIDRAVQSQALVHHPDSQAWQAAMAGAGVPVAAQGLGGWMDLGDGVALWVLWPPPELPEAFDAEEKNDRSLVMVLVYGAFRLLLTGDAEVPTERALLARGLPVGATVLKVGHHGSRTSSSPAFLRAVGAPLAVIQVGVNRYGHPHPQVLEALAGRAVLRTDRDGRIHLITDGQALGVLTPGGAWSPRSGDRSGAGPP